MKPQKSDDLEKKALPKTRTKIKKTFVVIACVLFSLVALAIGTWFFFLSKINYKARNQGGVATAPTQFADPSPGQNMGTGTMQWLNGDIISDTRIQNILIIGCDSRGTDNGRSDTILLISLNQKDNRLVFCSFLRDLYVKIAGMEDNRINASYSYGGPALLIDTIQNNFKIKIDNYIKVDFQSFKDLIDRIGGISIELTSDEVNELNNSGGYTEFGAIQKVKTGVNDVDGATALAYSRIREIGSDFARTERQQKVIQSIIAKLKTQSVFSIFRIANQFLPSIQTDLTSMQITGLMLDSGKLMNYSVAKLSIPVAGAYYDDYVREMWVLVPDLEKNKKVIWSLMYNQ
jgi:polyisoprenyl-teichoic acid--peptidoglycan teichoic acid transferase